VGLVGERAWCAGSCAGGTAAARMERDNALEFDEIFAAGYASGKEGEGLMAGETVTRARLSEAVYQEVGLSRNESAELVEAVIAEISEALERGEIVKISSFGSFAIRQKGQRIGRNPKTGQEVPISPRRVLVFRASHALKDQINHGLNDTRGGKTPSPSGAKAPLA
jgi:integration host factor subunit alpha